HTAADGSYRIDQLIGGEYRVGFYADGLSVHWYAGRPTSESADPVPVRLDHATTGIDEQFDGGAVVGRVSDAQHTGVAGITVDLFERTTGPGGDTWSYTSRATTGANGA